MRQKSKICLVVQRYGLEVNGGAELLTRQIAEKLTAFFDVTVLSSCAIDYMTWKNEYDEGKCELNGVHVIRFKVAHERNQEAFDEINVRFMTNNLEIDEEDEWLEKEGPFVPELIEYIKEHKEDYQTFLFFTYLYYPTVKGIPYVREKSIVFPFAHDEPFLKMHIFDNVFNLPRAIIFETEEERELIRSKYFNYHVQGFVGGAGVDIPLDIQAERFREKYNINEPYMIYVGRIDSGKNCEQLFDYFSQYKKEKPQPLKLVLMGKAVIEIPDDPNIISLGFVSDEDKFDGIAGSSFLVLPSKYESLSIVVLEAFALEKPVLVNGACDVLKAHCERSEGGYFYFTYNDFSSAVTSLLLDQNKNNRMGKSGKAYVSEKYNWDTIIYKIKDMIEYIQ